MKTEHVSKTNERKTIKLSSKKNGQGYVTSYTVNLGCAEVRECGFLDESGNPLPLEKIIDPENHRIIIHVPRSFFQSTRPGQSPKGRDRC